VRFDSGVEQPATAWSRPSPKQPVVMQLFWRAFRTIE
jgi:hypothetical protein